MSLFATSALQSTAEATPPPGYNLAWSDEFNGAVGSLPNSANWNFDLGAGGWGNGELETYVQDAAHSSIISDPAATDGLALQITATDDNGGVGTAGQYHSARLDSNGKVVPTYGYIEIRAKAPIGQGIWPAIWLLGADNPTDSWPTCGEQDIFEMFGNNDATNMTSYHMAYNGTGIDWSAAYTLGGGQLFDGGYHTFGELWTQQGVWAYVDGNQFEYHGNSFSGGWIFNHPFYFIMNMAVGGGPPGNPDATTTFPQHLDVDYIRVYEPATQPTSPGYGTVTDSCTSFATAYNTSGNFVIDGSNPAYFDGSAGRISCVYNGTEFVNYKYTNITGGRVTVGTNTTDNTSVTLWYSTNNGASYTQASTTNTPIVPTSAGWGVYQVYTNGTLPSGVTDLKIQKAPTANSWDHQFMSVTITSNSPAAPPPGVDGVNATAQNGNILLNWTSTSDATSYNIYRSTTAYSEFVSTPYATGVTGSSWVDTNVASGTTYYYVVAAVDSAGTGGVSPQAQATAAATAPVVPAAPGNLLAYGTSGADSVYWTSAAGATSYNVYRSTSSGTESLLTTGLTGTTFNDTSVSGGTTYYYKVAAVNAAGTSALSNEWTATPTGGSTLQPPTGLTASASNSQVSLSWTGSTGATSYNVYRGTSSGGESATPIATGLTGTTYTNTGLTNGTTYYFQVAAVNASGTTSGLSNEASATPNSSEGPYGGTPAAIPGTVQAENYDTGGQGVGYSVTAVNGSGNSYRTDGVDLEATTDTGGGYDVGWTGAGQWMRYTVNVATAGTYTVGFRVAAPSAVTDGFHLSNSSGANLSGNVNVPATGGWQTWTTVNATVSLPAGQQVLTLNQDTGGWNVNWISFTGQAALPQPPTGISASAGNALVNLSWTASTGATSYNLYRGTSPGGEGSTPVKTGITGSPYSDTGLTNGTTYYYKLAAVNSAGTSSLSTEASATPQGGTTEGPFGGTPASIPGTVSAANYDTGGQGVGYSVTAVNGTGNSYRTDGVDLEATSDSGGVAYNVGWTGAGQWFRYTVNVATAGTYNVACRVSNGTTANGSFHISNSSGTNLSGTITVAPTGGWQTWTTVNATVTLPAGQQVLTFNQDTGNYNWHWFSFASSGGGANVNIDCGGAAATPFVADTDFTGGATASVTNTIDTSLLSSPIPPQAVLQSNRYNAPTYTITGLTPGSSHTVTLYFAECYWTAAGKRVMNVSINGTQVLSNFDIFAAAGAEFKAVQKSFTATANSSGQIVITSTNVTDNAQFNGISVN